MGSHSADPFLSTIEQLGFGFVVMRAAGNVCRVNRVFAEIVDSSVCDVEGREARSFMDECNFGVFLEQQALRRQGRGDPYDLRLLSSQGASTRVHVFPTPLFDDGAFVGSCGLVLASSHRPGAKPIGAVPPQVKTAALDLLRASPLAFSGRLAQPATHLTSSEKEVLERLTPSTSVEELARELGTSATKVRSLLVNIYGKYGVRNRIELLALIHVLSDAPEGAA
ncbi:MAG TPA: LuxR C-terminal-related transcriptional regulator [Polyangiaceae bacterium]|nr:LuxR C-terminal-related transcriptional regulator [Polyangiaceae bacterium]